MGDPQAQVPYSRESMFDILGYAPAKHVCAETAHAMALAAYRRAVRVAACARVGIYLALTQRALAAAPGGAWR